MKVIDELFSAPQYSLANMEKNRLIAEELRSLTEHHRERCEPYCRILKGMYHSKAQVGNGLLNIPFLPVRLFKTVKLQSIADSEIMKVLASSGTTSQQVSKITLDRETSLLQTKALASIITSFIGPKRLPMIIIDSKRTLQDRTLLNARGAGILGLSNFGRDHFYALDDRMQLDLIGLKKYEAKYHDERILIFGFTFMIWQYLYGELRRRREVLSLEQAVLIHGGGWKKLNELAVNNESFKKALREQCGIRHIHNYYGMVEQVGSIYMECEHGHLHAPNYAEILIRDYRDWRLLPVGEIGIIETLSILPRSYPGHSLLTEDLGTIHGVDDCVCGRKGTHFTVQGRIQKAELRGCSDAHAYSSMQEFSRGRKGITQLLPSYKEKISLEKFRTNDFFTQTPLKPFDQKIIDFFSEVSQSIFKVPAIKDYPELVALAYWLRKSNITGMVHKFLQTVGTDELVMPRGITFHVAPSNVDTIFLYSWAVSLLAGNLNIVRISQTITSQIDILLKVLREVMRKSEWHQLAARNLVIAYPREKRINLFLSSRADVRMLWGGDETVQGFRLLPTKPATKDIIFADKVSYSLVNSERYLLVDEKKAAEIARLFYNDAYQFDQMACSSPRLVYFWGEPEQCEQASNLFWNKLSIELGKRNHHDGISVASNKLAFAYEVAAQARNAMLPYDLQDSRPTVMRVSLAEVPLCRNTCGGGFFVECFIKQVKELEAVTMQNDQTLSYVEFSGDEMKEIGHLLCTKGINRIVPVGQALIFTPVWDGYSLFNELTQRVQVL